MQSDQFDWVWQKTLEGVQAGGPVQPAPEMKDLLSELYTEACRRPADPGSLDSALTRILQFLARETEHTQDNCRIVSDFLMAGDDYWEEDWGELPEKYVEILGIMGHEMWQAVEDPDWAEQFGGSPEKILEQLQISDDRDSG